MQNELIDPIKIKKEMDHLVEMISHPAFVDAMRQLKAAPIEKRQELGTQLLTLSALTDKGVEMPVGMRLTTRYFEPNKPGFMQFDNDGVLMHGNTSDLIAQDAGGSACGGGMSFCGGAGGGS